MGRGEGEILSESVAGWLGTQKSLSPRRRVDREKDHRKGICQKNPWGGTFNVKEQPFLVGSSQGTRGNPISRSNKNRGGGRAGLLGLTLACLLSLFVGTFC